MTVHDSVLELIGRTPIVRARHLDAGCCEIFLKLESANPGGSIKDRIGMSMIEAAERAGKIKPGDTNRLNSWPTNCNAFWLASRFWLDRLASLSVRFVGVTATLGRRRH